LIFDVVNMSLVQDKADFLATRFSSRNEIQRQQSLARGKMKSSGDKASQQKMKSSGNKA